MTRTTRLAICPGSFDPLTLGHVAIISRALSLFDRVVIAVSVNIRKQPLFTLDERAAMIRASFPGEARIEVEQLTGLIAEWGKARGAVAIVKGLRAASDFEYELQMAQMNRHLNPTLDTIFLPTEADTSFVSSSLVKEVAALGGDISALVSPHVHTALLARLAERRA